MNRLFGFGNWDQTLTSLNLAFEEPTKILDKQTKQPKPDRWDCCYSASVRLTVRGLVRTGYRKGWTSMTSTGSDRGSRGLGQAGSATTN